MFSICKQHSRHENEFPVNFLRLSHLVSLSLHNFVVDLHSQLGDFALFRVSLHCVFGSVQQSVELALAKHLSVGHHRHEIEVNFALAVLLNALLDDGTDNVEPVLVADYTEIDGTFLETVEFVETSVDGQIRDEMENVFLQMKRN